VDDVDVGGVMRVEIEVDEMTEKELSSIGWGGSSGSADGSAGS
jgi:hypothetical protein